MMPTYIDRHKVTTDKNQTLKVRGGSKVLLASVENGEPYLLIHDGPKHEVSELKIWCAKTAETTAPIGSKAGEDDWHYVGTIQLNGEEFSYFAAGEKVGDSSVLKKVIGEISELVN